MINFYFNKLKILVRSLVIFLVFGACAKKEPPLNLSKLSRHRFALAEIIISRSAICPVCLRPVFNCELKSGLEDEFYKSIFEVFNEKGLEIVRLNRSGATDDNRMIEPWLILARQVGADYLILPVVYCWRERKGSEFSASVSAEVGFHWHIYQVASGKEVWGGNFNEQQRSLSENILELESFLKRGARWLKAEELAKEGSERLLEEFLGSLEKDDSNSRD